MNSLLIGYDLKKVGQNYDNLISALKEYGTYWHHLDSTWIIKTTKSYETVRDKLSEHIDLNDELIVINVTGDPAAWIGFPDSAGTWLKNHL